MAKLWVSSTTEDMDLLLTLRNIDPAGNDVLEVGQQGQPVPVAKGWLRVSHRELDPDLSLPYRPYHKHLRRLWLKPNEIVEVQVEIWPTSMVFKQGHRIRLDIQPRDGIGSAPYTHYHADYNVGDNTIYSGGDKDSSCSCRSFRRSSCRGRVPAKRAPTDLVGGGAAAIGAAERSASAPSPGFRFARPGM